MPGTKGGTWPFWSPDGQQVAFFANGKLKRVDLAGAPAITICDAKDGRGGDWNREGLILFAPSFNSGIFSVPASGGIPRQITQIDDQASKETTHRWPRFICAPISLCGRSQCTPLPAPLRSTPRGACSGLRKPWPETSCRTARSSCSPSGLRTNRSSR
jgi:WD40-like Beta Propeller Repeat